MPKGSGWMGNAESQGPWTTPMPWPRLAVIGILIVVFAVSLAVRWPYMQRAMGLHHEEGTGRTLVHMTAWWEDGPTSGGYLLRTTLTSPGDKFLSGAADEEGNAYYYSFPPGHPLWAFLVHRAIGVQPTVMSVRVFNLVLNLLSAVLVYLIVRELLRKLPDAWSRIAGATAFAAYAFTPITMWYQSNSYTTASAVQPFFLLALYAATRAYREGRWGRYAIAGVGAATFFMAYTEWLGFAFAGVAVVLALARRDDAVMRRIGIAALVGAAAAFGIVVVQYSTQLGFAGVFETFAGRYAARSGLDQAGGHSLLNPASWARLFRIYLSAVSPLAVAALALFAWDRFIGRGKARRFSAGLAPPAAILTLAIAPVLVHHAVLFNHTVVHDFDTLKTAVFLSVALGFLTGKLIARYAAGEAFSPSTAMLGSAALLLVVGGTSVWLFGLANSREYTEPKKLAEVIAAQAEDDEVVFIEAPAYVPVSITTYYAGRNWVDWRGDPAATANLLARGGQRTGVVFLVDEQLEVLQVGYVGMDGAAYYTKEEALATLGR